MINAKSKQTPSSSLRAAFPCFPLGLTWFSVRSVCSEAAYLWQIFSLGMLRDHSVSNMNVKHCPIVSSYAHTHTFDHILHTSAYYIVLFGSNGARVLQYLEGLASPWCWSQGPANDAHNGWSSDTANHRRIDLQHDKVPYSNHLLTLKRPKLWGCFIMSGLFCRSSPFTKLKQYAQSAQWHFIESIMLQRPGRIKKTGVHLHRDSMGL